MTIVLIKRENLETVKHTGRIPCEREGRDWGVVSTDQRPQKIASKPLEGRGKAWNILFLIALKRNQP